MSTGPVYIEVFGARETVTSAATSEVQNVNDAPQGKVIVSGDASEGTELTADASALSDEDGLGAFSYQWLRDGTPITGATAESYTLRPVEIGSNISVRVSYTDEQGNDEVVVSTASLVAPMAGTEGDDVIDGGPLDDRLEGLAGNDILDGGEANDVIAGGDGDDFLAGGGRNGERRMSGRKSLLNVNVDAPPREHDLDKLYV